MLRARYHRQHVAGGLVMILFIWAVALFFLALWSLAGWGLHAVVSTDGSWVGKLEPLIQKVPFGDLLERWLPTWQDLLRTALDLTQSGLAWLGAAAPVVVGVLWAIGAFLLLGTAGLLTVIVVILRRQTPPLPQAA